MSDTHEIKGIVDSKSQYGIKIKGQNNDGWLNFIKAEDRPKDKPYEKPEKGDMVELEWEKREDWKNAYVKWIRVMSKREAISESGYGAGGGAGAGGGEARLPWGFTSLAEYKYSMAMKDTDILYSVCLKAGTDIVAATIQKPETKTAENKDIAAMIGDIAMFLFTDYMVNRPQLVQEILGMQAPPPESDEPGMEGG